MSGCCHGHESAPPPPDEKSGGSCHAVSGGARFVFDPIFHGSLLTLGLAGFLWFAQEQFHLSIPYISTFAHRATDIVGQMLWGIALGILAVGLLHRVPRDAVAALLGRGDSFGGILRAVLAGLLLDLCSHGILMVGAKLYERGASFPQLIAFLVASPWNSLSLTFILVALVGLKWTLVFIAASAVVALSAGYAALLLTRAGKIPTNPNRVDLPEGFSFFKDLEHRIRETPPAGPCLILNILADGWREGRMILRWILFGALLAAAIQTFVPDDLFAAWFGPTLLGLGLTLVAATIIEVCSEGAAPIASDLVTRAAAPGNGFAFLMAGVATDYTELLVLRQIMGSWKTALLLPLLTVPQTILLGWMMNGF